MSHEACRRRLDTVTHRRRPGPTRRGRRRRPGTAPAVRAVRRRRSHEHREVGRAVVEALAARRRSRTTASRPASARWRPRHIPPEQRAQLQRSPGPLARGRHRPRGRARGRAGADAAAAVDAGDRPHRRAAGDRRGLRRACSTPGSRRSCASTARSAARATSRRSPHCALAADGRGRRPRRRRRAACRPPTRWPRPASRRSTLAEKEGLALINGTDGMLGMLVLAAARPAAAADAPPTSRAAMSVEALLGTDAVFAADLQALRPHPGQARQRREPARRCCAGSPIMASHRGPDVHPGAGRLLAALRAAGARRGARHRSTHAATVAERELAVGHRQPGRHCSTAGSSPTATSTAPRSPTCSTSSRSPSPTWRRSPSGAPTASSTWPAAHGLPPFLADDPGVDSGHMIAQYTQAAIVSELKRLAVPASRRLDPVLGDAGGPRLDGLVGRPQAAPRGRRADPGARDRAAHRGPRPRPARAARRRRRRPPPSSPALREHVAGPGPDRYLAPEIEAAVDRRHRPARRWPPPSPSPDRWLTRGSLRQGEATTWTAHARVRAPRGTTLTARSLADRGAAADAAEQPRPRGRRAPRRPRRLRRHRPGRARLARASTRMVRTLTTLERRRDDARAVRQAGRRDAHPRVGAARADRQLQPGRRLGDLAGVPPARAARPDDVRPDDRRLVDLHRHPGHPAGHLRDVRRGRRPKRFERHPGRHADRHRRLRRHGRRAAARGHDERRRLPGHRRRPSRGCSAGSSTATSTSSPTTSTTRSPGARRPRRERARLVGRAGRQLRRRCCPSCCAAASPSTSSPTRPRPTTRCPTCPRASTLDDWARLRGEAKPEEFTDRARASMAKHVEAMVGFQDAGAEVFDYGNSIRDEARQGGYRARVRLPGLRPRLHPAAVLRGQGPVPLGGAVRRPDGHRRHRPGRPRPVPGQRPPAPLDPRGPGAGRVPGTAGADLLARLRRAGQGRARGSTSWSPTGECRAPIVIGRDHLDCGSVASPYRETEAMADGSDAIADWPLLNALVNTAVGRDLGVDPPRRRRRHRPLDPRRAGQRRRRHRRWRRQKLARVLTNDPGMGVIRHVDAGYDARRRGRRRARACASRWRRSEGRTGLAAGDTAATQSEECHPAAFGRALPPSNLGRDPHDGGYRRFAWTARGRRRCASGSPARRRPAASTWSPTAPATSGPGGATRTRTARASSPARTWTRCPDGGAYDGPLGVVSRVRRARRAARPRLRARRGRSASSNFGDEEGARFGVACAGSRMLTGALRRRPGPRPRRRRRRHDGRGDERGPVATQRSARDHEALRRIGTFVELHVEQGRALVDLERAVGVATAIWPHGRWRVDCPARPTTPAPPGWPTGTTRCSPSPAPSSPPAPPPSGTAPSRPSARSASRPNGVNAIPSHVTAWLDARGAGRQRPGAGGRRRRRRAAGRATAQPRSRGRDRDVASTPALARSRLCRCCSTALRCWPPAPGTTPGILAAAGVPTAMLFVRNPTGVSHAPAEYAERRRLPGRRRRADARAARSWRRDATYWAEHACPPARDGLALDVRVRDRRRPVHRGADRARCRRGAHRLPGVVLPGFANAHSHAFHRALRGRTHAGGGTFWTWREPMYARRRPPRPGHLPRAGRAPRTPRWRWPGSRRSASSTTCTTGRAACPTPTRTRWARRCAPPRPTPASGSPCSTPATSPAGSSRRPPPLGAVQRRFGDARRRRLGRARRRCRAARHAGRRGGPLGARGAPRGDLRRGRGPRRAARCTCTCPSSRPRTTPAWRHYGCTPTAAARPTTACSAPTTTAVHATHLTRARHRTARRRRHRRRASARPPSATSPTASARPARCADAGVAALAGQRPARGHRPVRGGARAGAARAARDRCARPLHAGRAARPR